MEILTAQVSKRRATSLPGARGARKARKPAYPLGPRFAGPRQGLARGSAPFDPPGRPALRCGVRVRPAAVWFRSLPIARGLAAPLAPNARAGRGPRSRPRHRLPPQPRRRHAPPGVDAGGNHDGAAVRGGRTGDGFGRRPARPLRRQPRATPGDRASSITPRSPIPRRSAPCSGSWTATGGPCRCGAPCVWHRCSSCGPASCARASGPSGATR